MSSITIANHIHYHAGRLQAAADILLAISDDTGTSAIAELIQDSASAILLADTICPDDLPEAPALPGYPTLPEHPMCRCTSDTEPAYQIPGKPEHLRRLDREELKEELALGEVTTIPEAIQMLLAGKYTTSDLSHAIGCRNCEIGWAAQGKQITKAIKDYFRPLLPQTAESETPGEM